MLRKAVLGFALASGIAGVAYAQTLPPHFVMPSPNAPLTVTPLRGGAYWVKGGISNTGFIIGDRGVIVIDAQTFTIAAKNEQAAIAKLTPLPVNEIIITHSDPDHINGLPAWPAGVEIVAQDSAAAEMQHVVLDPHSNGLPPPPEIKNYMPTHLIQSRESRQVDGVRLVLIHTGPAHTDGDLLVYLPDQKIVFAGDLLTPSVGPYPGIHLNKHGSSLGWVASIKAMLALDADTFISGHGEPLTRSQIEARVLAAEQRRAAIKAMVDKGMTLAQIKTALNDPPPTGEAAIFPTFTETTYQELTVK